MQIDMKLLSIPLSAAPSERCWSNLALFTSKEESRFLGAKVIKLRYVYMNTQSSSVCRGPARSKFSYLRPRKKKIRVALSVETGIRDSGDAVTRPMLKHNSPRRLLDNITRSTAKCCVGWDAGRRRHNWVCDCNFCNYRGRRSCRVDLFGRRCIYWGGKWPSWWCKQWLWWW